MNTLLCLSLASRIVEPKLGLKLGLFVIYIYMNVNMLFSKSSQSRSMARAMVVGVAARGSSWGREEM